MKTSFTLEDVEQLIRELENRQSEFNHNFSSDIDSNPVDLYVFFSNKFRSELHYELENLKNLLRKEIPLSIRQIEILQYIQLYLSFSYAKMTEEIPGLRRKKVFQSKLDRRDIREVINWANVRKPGTSNYRKTVFSEEPRRTGLMVVQRAEPVEEYEIVEIESVEPPKQKVEEKGFKETSPEPEESKKSNEARTKRKIRIRTLKRITGELYDKKYAYFADHNSGFSESALKDVQTDGHIYILAFTSPSRGVYFISSRKEAQEKALRLPSLLLDPACEYSVYNRKGSSVLTTQSGQIRKTNDVWYIERKAQIAIV